MSDGIRQHPATFSTRWDVKAFHQTDNIHLARNATNLTVIADTPEEAKKMVREILDHNNRRKHEIFSVLRGKGDAKVWLRRPVEESTEEKS